MSSTDDVEVDIAFTPLGEEIGAPEYATDLSAGMDLQAAISEAITLEPGERRLVPTGIFIAVPAGYEAQVRPRSGLALKEGITIPNAPGTIDADYRGQVKVILANIGQQTVRVEPGDRIAQMVVAQVSRVQWRPCETLDETSRGEGGFGHTGR